MRRSSWNRTPFCVEGLYRLKWASVHGPATKSRRTGTERRGLTCLTGFSLASRFSNSRRTSTTLFSMVGTERDAPENGPRLPEQHIALPACGADPNPETGHPAVPDRVFLLPGPQTRNAFVGEPHVRLARQCSALQHAADRLHRLAGHRIGGMSVFEGRLRGAMSEQPGDGEDGFALPQGEAGMRVAEIVKTDVGEFRLGADPAPERVEPSAGPRPTLPRRREDPAAPPLEPVQDVPGRLRQPDGPGPGLAVAQEEMTVAVIGSSGASGSRSCGIPSAGGAGWPRPEAGAAPHGRGALRTGGGFLRR